LASVFAQRRNLVSPGFFRMLRDLLRFNALATRLAQSGHDGANWSSRWRISWPEPVQHRVSRLVFSADDRLHLELPHRPDAAVPGRHHDPVLPQPRSAAGSDRPQWWTVAGGARHYVDKIVAGISDKRLATPCWPSGAMTKAPRSHRRGLGNIRPRGPGHPQRPVAGPAGRRRRQRAPGAGRHPLPAQSRRPAHRHLGAATRPQRLGRLELRARRTGAGHVSTGATGLPALPAQPVAAAALGAARAGVTQSASRNSTRARAG
jgi:hypothetical protein